MQVTNGSMAHVGGAISNDVMAVTCAATSGLIGVGAIARVVQGAYVSAGILGGSSLMIAASGLKFAEHGDHLKAFVKPKQPINVTAAAAA